MVKFQKKVFNNGLVLLFEKRDLPVVSVAFAVRAGGINENAEEKGISHFIEHMLYKGTPSRDARKIAEEIEKNGGVLNGFTDEEITAFWCKMPSRHINVALEVLGDMVRNPLFDDKEIEKERKVIFEEIKMRNDNPMIYCADKINEYLYDGDFSMSLIGTEKTLKSLNRDKLQKKFKELYQPNNLILCVVGDANFDNIVAYIENNFKYGKGTVPQVKFTNKNREGIESREGLTQSNMIFAYHVPLAKDKKSYAAEILNTILAEGMSSRLFREIREKRNLAYSVRGDSMINKDYAYNYIYVGTNKENIAKVKELIVEEFQKVAKDLDEKELNQAKDQLIGNYQISTEDSQSQMVSLLSYEIANNAEEYYKYEKEVSQIKIEDVKELARKAAEKHSFFALVPK
ncbi:MAG: pitrilysin family protein [Candidatus Nanoarchaeia archaeon]